MVFHFALPAGAGRGAAFGLLWVALVFTSLLGLARAWLPEREAGAIDGLVLAPCDRSAIWLGKTLATLAFLGVAELVALPAFALFFAPLDASLHWPASSLASIGLCAVGSLVVGDGRRQRAAGRWSCRCCFLPLAIPLVVGGVGAAISAGAAPRTCLPRRSTTRSSRYFRGPRFEYVVTE